MRRWVLVALAVCLVAPAAFGQWVANIALPGGNVSPGERVLAQDVVVVPNGSGAMGTGATASGPAWTYAENALGEDGLCASTSADGAGLCLDAYSFYVPEEATILDITVMIKGAASSDSSIVVRLWHQEQYAPLTQRTGIPLGDCADPQWVGVGGAWGRSWAPAAVNSNGIRVELIASIPGSATICVDDVQLYVLYALPSTVPSTISALRVQNTAPSDIAVKGSDIEKIEVVRTSDGKVIGSLLSASELAKFTTTGASISITSGYRAFTAPVELETHIKLKSSVALGKEFTLGETYVTVDGGESLVDYSVPSAWYTVGPPPAVAFDGSLEDAEIYHGQRFLAGRINVDAGDVPFDVTITRLVLSNVASGTRLSGSSIARVEILRASDGALLGDLTTDAELAKLTTTGCAILTSSNNKVVAYGQAQLEIWVTLETLVPTGRALQLTANVRIGGADSLAGDNDPAGDLASVFTVGQAQGFEEVTNLELTGGQVFSRQRFLAQRIQVVDNDVAPFDVTTTSVVVKNVADGTVRLAENQIALIELVRARDGALMGSVSGASGLNAGGVRVTAGANNVVVDDTTEAIEIWVTLQSSVPDDRVVQLQTTVWHTEDATVFGTVTGSGAEFATGPAVGAGFETATSSAELTSRTVLSGGRFLAQRLVLTDSDADPYDVTVTSVMIRNVVGDNWLADQNVARLEVRRKSDGALLGEVVDPVGLSLAGVRLTASANGTVADDSTVTLEIWVTLKVTAPAGRKLKLESIVWHAEGVAPFQTAALAGPAIFTTKVGTPPSNVDFTWTPAAPKYNQEITFTPAANIADPEGAITKAAYSWNFGDGGTVSTTGAAAVKHTYTTGGTFSVVLTVTGEAGLSSSKTNAVAVEGPPNVAPTVSFTWTPQAPAEITTVVTFTSTVTDSDQPTGTAFTYAWDFGDTTTSADANPTHAFAEKKTYTVKLTVTDAQSASVTVEHTISVGNTAPVVGTLTALPTAPNTGDSVTFTVGATDADTGDTIASFKWTFAPEATLTTIGTTLTATHTFNAPGTYIVSVIAVDSRGGESTAKTVTVTVSGPTRVIVYSYPNPASTQATFNLLLPDGTTSPVLRIFGIDGRLVLEEDLGAGATSYLWNLLDTAGNPVGNGLYLCVVTATADGGGSVRSEIFRLLIVR
jgi:PKD repeat protein